MHTYARSKGVGVSQATSLSKVIVNLDVCSMAPDLHLRGSFSCTGSAAEAPPMPPTRASSFTFRSTSHRVYSHSKSLDSVSCRHLGSVLIFREALSRDCLMTVRPLSE